MSRTTNEIVNYIRSGIDNGVIGCVGLKRRDKGKEVVIVPLNKSRDQVAERFRYIIHRLEGGAPGSYILMAATSYGQINGSATYERFEINKGNEALSFDQAVVVNKQLREEPQPVPAYEAVSLDDYHSLMRENDELRRRIERMELEQAYDKKLQDVRAELSDKGGGFGEKLAGILAENAHVITPLLERLADKIMSTPAANQSPVPLRSGGDQGADALGDQYPVLLRQLLTMEESSQAEFDKQLSLIEETNPLLYQRICEDLNIVEEEEEIRDMEGDGTV